MHNQIKILQNIVSRRGSSKVLTFSIPHVFLALKLLNDTKYVSRSLLCGELHLGEGAVKTLISHLREVEFVNAVRSGTYLTLKGKHFAKHLFDIIPFMCTVPICGITKEQFNHAIILKHFSKHVGNGMQQRDYAILYGASGAISMLFKDGHFIFPKENTRCFKSDKKTESYIISNLSPNENDLVIITSAKDPFVAKISAINSALWTIAVN